MLYCRYRADSPQKLPFFGEDILTFSNPLLHHMPHNPLSINPLAHIPPNGHNPHNAGWRCVPYNPMAMALDPCHVCPPWEPELLAVNKGPKEARSKMTIPKSVVVEVSEESESSSDMDETSLEPPDGEEMEQETVRQENRAVPRKASRLPLARQVSRPSVRRSGGRWISNADRRLYEDYRRFSGRSRKKTDFFGINGQNRLKEQDGKHHKEGWRAQPKDRGRKMADFSSKLHHLDEKLAGSVEAEVVSVSAGKEVGKEESPAAGEQAATVSNI